jgi:hypothetical protein
VRLKPLGHLSDAANNSTNLAERLDSRTSRRGLVVFYSIQIR